MKKVPKKNWNSKNDCLFMFTHSSRRQFVWESAFQIENNSNSLWKSYVIICYIQLFTRFFDNILLNAWKLIGDRLESLLLSNCWFLSLKLVRYRHESIDNICITLSSNINGSHFDTTMAIWTNPKPLFSHFLQYLSITDQSTFVHSFFHHPRPFLFRDSK